MHNYNRLKRRLLVYCLCFILGVTTIYGTTQSTETNSLTVSYEQIVATGKVKDTGKTYTVAGKPYKAKLFEAVVFFTYKDSQGKERIVTDVELLAKLIYTYNINMALAADDTYIKIAQAFQESNKKVISLYHNAVFAHTLSNMYGRAMPALVTKNASKFIKAVVEDAVKGAPAEAMKTYAYITLWKYSEYMDEFIGHIQQDKLRDFDLLIEDVQHIQDTKETYMFTIGYMNKAYNLPKDRVEALKIIFIDDMLSGFVRTIDSDGLNMVETIVQTVLTEDQVEKVIGLGNADAALISLYMKHMNIQNNAVSHMLDNADVIVNNTEALIDFASWVYKCMEAIESVESDRYKDIYDLEKAKETLTILANNQNSRALTTSQLQNVVNKKGFSIQLSKCIDVNKDNVNDYIVLAYKSGKTPTWGEKEYLLIVDGKQSRITQCYPIDYMEYSDIIAKECKGIVHFLIKIEGELMEPYAMYSILNGNKLVEHNQFIRRADPTLWLTNDGIKFVYSGSNIKPIFKLSHSEYQTIKKEWAYQDGSGFIECFGGVAEAYFDGDTLVVKSDKFGFFIHSYFEWNGSTWKLYHVELEKNW